MINIRLVASCWFLSLHPRIFSLTFNEVLAVGVTFVSRQHFYDKHADSLPFLIKVKILNSEMSQCDIRNAKETANRRRCAV